jgi:hypothetical protein
MHGGLKQGTETEIERRERSKMPCVWNPQVMPSH